VREGGKDPGLGIAVHTIEPKGTSVNHIETFLEQVYRLKDSGKTNVRTGIKLEITNPMTGNSLHVKVTLDPNWKLEE
jgi:hypothetical protein